MVNQFPVAEVPINSESVINTLETKPQEFALYLDESGSPKPSPDDSSPFFAMGGVLIERSNEDMINSLLVDFKNRWNIPQNIPLHGNEIRSRKKRFAWLGKLCPFIPGLKSRGFQGIPYNFRAFKRQYIRTEALRRRNRVFYRICR